MFTIEQEDGAVLPSSTADDAVDGQAAGTADAPITLSDDEDTALQEALRLSREDLAEEHAHVGRRTHTDPLPTSAT